MADAGSPGENPSTPVVHGLAVADSGLTEPLDEGSRWAAVSKAELERWPPSSECAGPAADEEPGGQSPSTAGVHGLAAADSGSTVPLDGEPHQAAVSMAAQSLLLRRSERDRPAAAEEPGAQHLPAVPASMDVRSQAMPVSMGAFRSRAGQDSRLSPAHRVAAAVESFLEAKPAGRVAACPLLAESRASLQVLPGLPEPKALPGPKPRAFPAFRAERVARAAQCPVREPTESVSPCWYAVLPRCEHREDGRAFSLELPASLRMEPVSAVELHAIPRAAPRLRGRAVRLSELPPLHPARWFLRAQPALRSPGLRS